MSSLACSQNCPEEPSGVAYETLLLDSMRGVATLLTRRDEVEAEWRIITPIEEAWAHLPPPDFPNYAAGSEGPSSWNELLEIRGNIAEAAIGNGKSCLGLPPGTPCSVAAPVDCMSMRPLRLVSFQEVIESLQEEKTLMKTPIDEKRFGPWALVTGASSGIGKEFVRQLAAAGLNVALVARRETLLYAVGQGIAKDFNVQYRTVVADLSQGGFLDKLAKATNDLDIGLVVSNAGTGNPGEFLKIDRVELENLLRLNTLAHLDIAHQFGQRLVGRGQGGLLFVGAMGADKGVPYMANDGGANVVRHAD